MTATIWRRPHRDRPLVVHVTTTDMSLDWLLAPQLIAFSDAGFDVVGMSAPGPHVAHLEALGIAHVPLPAFTRSTDPLSDVRAFAQLLSAFRRLRPDIVHTHNPKPGILGRIAARLTRVPLIVNTQHGLYAQPTDRRRRRWPVYAAERVAAAFGHLELVQNPEDVDTLVGRLRVPAGKVRLLGNGIDLARFDPASVDPTARERIRAEWGIGPADVVIGTVGRLVREKGVAELAAMAEHLAQRPTTARVVFVGPDDPAKSDAVGPEHGAAGVSLDATSHIVFAGQRTDMPECYAAMDVFVTASWREGFPRSAMEAAAMGLPVVGTDIRGTRQVVEHTVTGLLVPVRDPDALTAAVVRLIENPTLRADMSAAARARAIEAFDQEIVIERTLAAYGLRTGREARLRPRSSATA